MSSKTYFSKPNINVKYEHKKDNLQQIVLELTSIAKRLEKLINNKEKE
jgi:hypothetical protein